MKRKLLAVAITASLAGVAAYGPSARGEEPTTGNHLSYPAMLLNGVQGTPFSFAGVGEGTFGANYSYGCAKEEKVTVSRTTFTYPNTSCVTGWNADGSAIAFLDAAACVLPEAPCAGLSVDRIYWQKIDGNVWTAESTAVSAPVTVRWVDWGDSIESKTWSGTSILRVETQGYADLSVDPRSEAFTVCDDTPDLAGDEVQCQVGLQMWHSQGHGITEEWGVRTTEVDTAKGAPYVYASPYAIVNAGTADLYLSKMETGAPPTCPKTYAGPYFTDRGWTGSGWTGACNLPVVPYTDELSVTGKYVHGYNWRVRDLPTALLADTYCPDETGSWSKTGWWRLTFVPNGGNTKMQFGDTVTIGPPVTPSSEPAVLSAALAAAEPEEETDGSLYRPEVSPSTDLNLTWIDLCITSKTGGGGGGKPGGGTGGGKPPGAGSGKPR